MLLCLCSGGQHGADPAHSSGVGLRFRPPSQSIGLPGHHWQVTDLEVATMYSRAWRGIRHPFATGPDPGRLGANLACLSCHHQGRKQPARGPGCRWAFQLHEPNIPFLALVHLGWALCRLSPEAPGHEQSTSRDWFGFGAELGCERPPLSLQFLANMICDRGT